MEIENIHEAKAFVFFLTQERTRHQVDIEQIDDKIRKVTLVWDFWIK